MFSFIITTYFEKLPARLSTQLTSSQMTAIKWHNHLLRKWALLIGQQYLEVVACLTVDAVLLQPPLTACSIKTFRSDQKDLRAKWWSLMVDIISILWAHIRCIRHIPATSSRKKQAYFLWRIEMFICRSLCQCWLVQCLLISQRTETWLHSRRVLLFTVSFLMSCPQLLPVWAAKLQNRWYCSMYQ